MTKMISNLQAHLALIVESSNDAIISKTMDGIITYWNKGAEQIFGYSPEEILGKSINTLIPHGVDEHKTLLERYERGEKFENFETQRIKKDGAIINASLTISPIFDEQKKTVGFSVIARDITKNIAERKKSEAAEREKETARLDELEKFRKLIVGRELKMIELKKEIEDLKNRIPKI